MDDMSDQGGTRCAIQRSYYTKILLSKVLFLQRHYCTKVLIGPKSDQYLIFNWNMKLWAFSHPLMSQSKYLNPNLLLGRFQCRLSSVTITRSGATPASAVTSPSQMLTRPVHVSITRHSDINSTARSACSRQTRHPTTSLPETKSAHSSFGAPLRASRQSQ